MACVWWLCVSTPPYNLIFGLIIPKDGGIKQKDVGEYAVGSCYRRALEYRLLCHFPFNSPTFVPKRFLAFLFFILLLWSSTIYWAVSDVSSPTTTRLHESEENKIRPLECSVFCNVSLLVFAVLNTGKRCSQLRFMTDNFGYLYVKQKRFDWKWVQISVLTASRSTVGPTLPRIQYVCVVGCCMLCRMRLLSNSARHTTHTPFHDMLSYNCIINNDVISPNVVI